MGSHRRKTYMEEILDENRIEASGMIEEKLIAFYSRGVPAVNIWMALSFFAKMKYHQVSFTSPSTVVYLACLIVSALTDTAMTFMFETRRRFMGRWMIAYLSTFLQISAATALMLFFNTAHTVTVVLLFCLVLVLFIYFFCKLIGTPEKDHGLRWLEFKEPLNRGFEMSSLVVAPSVAGLSGKVLGYVEGSSQPNLSGSGHMAVSPEGFLFYSAVSGLLVILICTVPPSLRSTRDVMSLAYVYIPRIAYMALFFLVLATVVAAQKILQVYVYFVCCAIAIIALLLCLFDAQEAGSYDAPEAGSYDAQEASSYDAQEAGSSDDVPKEDPSDAERRVNDERQAKLSKYLFTTSISPILLAIIAIHSSDGGIGSTVPLSWTWKAFVSLALCSILSHMVRIVVLDQTMTSNIRYEISVKFWTYWSLASITITAVFAVFVICLHPDEVTNIF